MTSLTISAFAAFWIGILTSISPCPLATNIAAVSYISRRTDSAGYVLRSGLLYVLGRMFVYVVIGFLLIKGLLSTTAVSFFLQKYANQLLGPLLIIVGMFLLNLLDLKFLSFSPNWGMKDSSGKTGALSAFFMGSTFALSFCPVSAALYFGSLVPLAAKHGSAVLLPSLFGLGSGLPVVIFAFLLAAGLQSAGKFFDAASRLERWSRRVTGWVFILTGVFLSLKYIFGLL